MKNKITILIVFFALCSCKNNESENIEKDKMIVGNWLLGKWENKSVDGKLTEEWSKLNDSTYQATSYFIKMKDTLHHESITLQQNGEQLTYVAAVKGQNDDKPVTFNQLESTESKLVFENLKNDYPKKISYTQISKDSIAAEVSGIQQGKASSEKFIMSRIK
ncbi:MULTISPECIES: DUF6265 family protein [Flavobacterium]|uniref:DUF6265 domain-containing protein n=1 Tax=Flavobacterium weaverense TaxID=271156 RepID=A0A3M0AFX0_9FLAO|nr:DUF6265 family protein [Flavobacterium weaverense]RMA78112.1 hypothetical protein BC961_0484 [Flavobacterium weaverense]